MRRHQLVLFTILFCTTIASAVPKFVKVLSSSPLGITFEFQPQWETTSIEVDGRHFEKIAFENAEFAAEPGEPLLPKVAVLIGVPEAGDVSMQVIDAEFDEVADVVLAPRPEIVHNEVGFGEKYFQNAEAYSVSQFVPSQEAELETPYYFQSQKVSKIILQPLQYNPSAKKIRRFKRLVVHVTFSGGNQRRVTPIEKNEFVYRNMLLNYEQARQWRKVAQPSLKKNKEIFFKGDNWYKIAITSEGNGGKEGIYKLTGAALKEALAKNNLSLGDIDPTTIQLFNNGGRVLSHDILTAKNDTLIENPILVIGGQDGSFQESDYILFYGQSVEGIEASPGSGSLSHYIHPYTYDNIYWLTFNKARGKRIETIPSVDGSSLVEESSFRDLAWLEEERYNIYHSGIIWLGHELKSADNTYSVNFSLPGAVPDAEALFRFSLASLTSGRHYFSMYANGNSLGQFDQSGATSSFYLNTAEFAAPGVLMDGDNTITINYNVSSQTAFSYVNFIEVEYQRRFLAIQDQLLFFAPLKGGPARYRISNFSSDNAYILDITDLSAIKRIQPNDVSSGIVDFADYCDSFISKRYIVATPAAFKTIEAASITPEKITGIRKSMSNVDYIIITYDDFYQQALQLESLRENWDPTDRLETEIVNYSDVIKEFGWGIADPAAIRNFLAFARDNWGNPKYVLLIGDGHYDYKNILKNNIPNLIVPYETDGNYENWTRTTDDWFTYTNGNSAGMQMAIGRLIVQTVDEAQHVIDKIVQYETAPEYGEWLKTVTIVADDEYTNNTNYEIIHTEQAERLAENYVPDLLNVKKIYLINYPAVRTASITGREKPAATLDLMQQINQGSLIINYIGHGNDELWAHEKVLDNSRDFDKFNNGKRMAMWVAATCEFAQWDQPTNQSFAEKILSVPNRGGVTMVSSARLAFSDDNAWFNYRLYENLFADYEQTGLTARTGDAVMLAKIDRTDRKNNEKYALFGDPAMRLRAPRYRAVVDSITPDSIQALSTMSIVGHVEDAGRPLTDYAGKLLLRVIDTRKAYVYKSPDGVQSGTLMKMGNNIFRGIAAVENGAFNVKFIVPKDISYGGDDAGISLYFWNDNSSGTGAVHGLPVGSTGANLIDNQGPKMHLYFDNPNFVPGDYVSTRPTLTLSISDSVSGVNTAGDIGHQILLTLDEDYANSEDITEFFTYNEGSYTDGTLKYSILDLPLGEHSVQVKAWDNANNSSIVETQFVVIDDSNLEVRNVLTFPNPMYDECSIRYELSQDAEVSVRIYTVAGRLLKKFEPTMGHVGYNVFPETWDGRDSSGDHVANGVYLYKISAKSFTEDKSITAEKIGKLIVAR